MSIPQRGFFSTPQDIGSYRVRPTNSSKLQLHSNPERVSGVTNVCCQVELVAQHCCSLDLANLGAHGDHDPAHDWIVRRCWPPPWAWALSTSRWWDMSRHWCCSDGFFRPLSKGVFDCDVAKVSQGGTHKYDASRFESFSKFGRGRKDANTCAGLASLIQDNHSRLGPEKTDLNQ